MTRVIVYLTWISLIAAACSSPSGYPNPTVNPQPRHTVTGDGVLRGPTTPTITPEPIMLRPTLTNEEIDVYLDTLLANNLDCQIPCLFGMLVGKTQSTTARNFIEAFAGKGSAGGIVGYENSVSLPDYSLSLSFDVYPSSGVMEKIVLGLSGSDLIERAAYFSFENLVTGLGEPDMFLVKLQVEAGVNEPSEASFELLFFYKEINTLLIFHGMALKKADGCHVCPGRPNYESTFVEHTRGNIDIYVGIPEENATPRSLVNPIWILPTYYISPEDAFGISAKEMYISVLESGKDACFFSPPSVWQ